MLGRIYSDGLTTTTSVLPFVAQTCPNLLSHAQEQVYTATKTCQKRNTKLALTFGKKTSTLGSRNQPFAVDHRPKRPRPELSARSMSSQNPRAPSPGTARVESDTEEENQQLPATAQQDDSLLYLHLFTVCVLYSCTTTLCSWFLSEVIY